MRDAQRVADDPHGLVERCDRDSRRVRRKRAAGKRHGKRKREHGDEQCRATKHGSPSPFADEASLGSGAAHCKGSEITIADALRVPADDSVGT